MTKETKQNGCQPPVQQGQEPRPETSTDSSIKNAQSTTSPDKKPICRDFIWGICIKGARCSYRHERDLDYMKTVLKFCHDYQNKSGCLRTDCTYLHTTREEQNLFLTEGQIPKLLAERYEALSAVMSGNTSGLSAECKQVLSGLPIVNTTQKPSNSFSRLPVQPSPQKTKTNTTDQVDQERSSSTTAKSHVPKQKLNQREVSPGFDASVPPPVLVSHNDGGAQKRPAEPIEAGPSKIIKQEDTNGIETVCDNCLHRKIRIQLLLNDTEKLKTEKEQKTVLLEKRTKEYEHVKLILKPLVKPELFQILEKNLENMSSRLGDPEALLKMNSSLMTWSQPAKTLMTYAMDHAATNGSNKLTNMPFLSKIIPGDVKSPILDAVNDRKNSIFDLMQTLSLMYGRTTDSKPDIKPIIDPSSSNNPCLEIKPFVSGFKIDQISELLFNTQNSINLQMVKTSEQTTSKAVVSSLNITRIENGPTTIVPFQPSIPPPNIRPMLPSIKNEVKPDIPNLNPVNSMIAPPSMPSVHPFKSSMKPMVPQMHPESLAIRPKTSPQQSVTQTHIASISTVQPPVTNMPPPNIPTSGPILHPPKSMLQVPTSTVQSVPKSTSIESPASTVQPSKSTLSSKTINRLPTPIRPSLAPMNISASKQEPRMIRTALAIKSPIRLQRPPPFKHFTRPNGKIFIPRNGIFPRPRFFPPFQ